MLELQKMRQPINEESRYCTDRSALHAIYRCMIDRDLGYNIDRKSEIEREKFQAFERFKRLPVAQWIVHMPPKRGIQVRFLSGGPTILFPLA